MSADVLVARRASRVAQIAAERPPLAVAVDDARAVEIVWRELAADAIAREDADPEASHLARDVPEYDVVVVELHTEHCVRQRLDYLALEFDLVFLSHELYPVWVRCAMGADPVLKCAPSNYQRRRIEACAGALGYMFCLAKTRSTPRILLTQALPECAQRAGSAPPVPPMGGSGAFAAGAGCTGSCAPGAGEF